MRVTQPATKRGGVLFLALPVAPHAPKGTCRWCGHKLNGKRASIRRYCYPDREGRDYVQAFATSMTWNPRQALLAMAQKEGKELRCADCGFFVGVRLNDDGRYEERAWEADHEIPLWGGRRAHG